ncbi:MAG: cytochrome c [bacterium]|nr:cytochrome c [bacterium]
MYKILVLITTAFLMMSCGKKSMPVLEYMPDMYRQPSLKAQEFDPNSPNGVGMKVPPVGTVPVNFEPYSIALLDTLAANATVNPVTATTEVLDAGRKYYNTYCVVCHGVYGDGAGYIVPKFTQPPSLLSEKLLGWSDGRIYHTIMMGQGLMPSKAGAAAISSRFRRRRKRGGAGIIHYVRALPGARRTSAAAGQRGRGADPPPPPGGRRRPRPGRCSWQVNSNSWMTRRTRQSLRSGRSDRYDDLYGERTEKLSAVAGFTHTF